MNLHFEAQKFMDTGEPYISDDDGKYYTIEESELLWNNGQVENCNQAFQRLASFDFSLSELYDFYLNNS